MPETPGSSVQMRTRQYNDAQQSSTSLLDYISRFVEPFLSKMVYYDVQYSEERCETCIDAEEDSPHEDHNDEDNDDGEEDQAPGSQLIAQSTKLSLWKRIQVSIYVYSTCRSTYSLHHCKRCWSLCI